MGTLKGQKKGWRVLNKSRKLRFAIFWYYVWRESWNFLNDRRGYRKNINAISWGLDIFFASKTFSLPFPKSPSPSASSVLNNNCSLSQRMWYSPLWFTRFWVKIEPEETVVRGLRRTVDSGWRFRIPSESRLQNQVTVGNLNAPITTHHSQYKSQYSTNYQSQCRAEHSYIRLNFRPSLESEDDFRSVTKNCPSQDCFHPDDQIPARNVILELKPFAIVIF